MKKIYRSVLFATGFLAFAAAPALAQQENLLEGFYAVATVGSAEYDNDEIPGFSTDDSDTGFSAGIGYEFNKYIAVEAGYLDLGETSLNGSDTVSGTLYGSSYTISGTLNAEAEVDGFYLGPQVSFPVTDAFDLYAKAGVFFWDLDVSAAFSGSLTYEGTVYSGSGTATYSDDGEDLYYGLGASYDVTDTFTVRADWTRYDDVSDTDIDYYSAGLVFRFGKLF